MIKAKDGIWGYTAQDFNNIILYFGLNLEDMIVFPRFFGSLDELSTEYDFVNKHSWKAMFHITDRSVLLHIDTDVSWYKKGDVINLADILGEPEHWAKLFVKELFNVQY